VEEFGEIFLIVLLAYPEKAELKRAARAALIQSLVRNRIHRFTSDSVTLVESYIRFLRPVRFEMPGTCGMIIARMIRRLINRRIVSGPQPSMWATSLTEYIFSMESISLPQGEFLSLTRDEKHAAQRAGSPYPKG